MGVGLGLLGYKETALVLKISIFLFLFLLCSHVIFKWLNLVASKDRQKRMLLNCDNVRHKVRKQGMQRASYFLKRSVWSLKISPCKNLIPQTHNKLLHLLNIKHDL